MGRGPLPSIFTKRRPIWTGLSVHELARPGTVTRTLAIPNPVRHYHLAKEVVAAWSTITAAILRSPLTLTAPIDDPSGNRALVPRASFGRVPERAQLRAALPYVLKADVAQFYPSIYTHSLAWALHGKAAAKAAIGDWSLFGNRLDRLVSAAQDGQTVGIPIGPDTSLVLAEIVLSACDASLTSRVQGFRYFDDYELYFPSLREAERARLELQRALATYHLTLNPLKTRIVSLPLEMQDEWITQLQRTHLRKVGSGERADLTVLFDDAFRYQGRFPGRHVVSYALGLLQTRLSNGEPLVDPVNWPFLQRLILQSLQAQPTAIQKAVGLLDWARHNGLTLDSALLKYALNGYVARHAALGDASEVAWALWAAIAFRVRILKPALDVVEAFPDDVVAILALHAHAKGLMGRGDPSLWESWVNGAGLNGEHWLAAYESQVHGWITPSPAAGDPIAAHEGFDFLRSGGVTFYDESTGAVRKPRAATAPFRWRRLLVY